MKIIGLTGGIGSGKTTVAHLFRESGIPVYIADDEAKRISETPGIITQIVAVFGDSVLDNGKVNRQKLAAIVFDNPKKLTQLNNIIHPAVKKDFQEWILRHEKSPFLIKETAILFESGNNQDCDLVITVMAPLETRIKRVMERDGSTREDIVSRIKNQWTDAMRIAKSDYVIENVNLNETKQQVKEILKNLQNL